jgi:hypothetical protein
MANRLTEWIRGRKTESREITLEDVTPLHPDDYPARHLKEILDGRRSRFAGRASEPTGMPDGPGPLT